MVNIQIELLLKGSRFVREIALPREPDVGEIILIWIDKYMYSVCVDKKIEMREGDKISRYEISLQGHSAKRHFNKDKETPGWQTRLI